MKFCRRLYSFFLMVGIVCMFILSGCSQEPVEELVIDTTDSIEGDSQKEIRPDKKQMIYVHVCGAVENPGVYELEEGSRVTHAVEAAGGLCRDADSQGLNLARLLCDGEQVVVLTVEQMQKQSMIRDGEESGKVNLNTADAEELMTLHGIGEAKADAILSYRKEHGNFQKTEEICEVEGIGEGIFEKIKESITVH